MQYMKFPALLIQRGWDEDEEAGTVIIFLNIIFFE